MAATREEQSQKTRENANNALLQRAILAEGTTSRDERGDRGGRSGKYCQGCKLPGHVDDECRKQHPSLMEKWKREREKKNRRKRNNDKERPENDRGGHCEGAFKATKNVSFPAQQDAVMDEDSDHPMIEHQYGGLATFIAVGHELAVEDTTLSKAFSAMPSSMRPTLESVIKKVVILNSGCTNHNFIDKAIFIPSTLKPYTGRPILGIGGVRIMPSHTGTARMRFLLEGKAANVLLNNSFLCPEIGENLVSVSQLTKKGADVTFGRFQARCTRDGNMLLRQLCIG